MQCSNLKHAHLKVRPPVLAQPAHIDTVMRSHACGAVGSRSRHCKDTAYVLLFVIGCRCLCDLCRCLCTLVTVDRLSAHIYCLTVSCAVCCLLQVFVEHAFSSCVRCLATDADSDVMWAGDEAGRLAVFRCVGWLQLCVQQGHCHSLQQLSCGITALFLDGRGW